jgi:hypothetical protein
MSALTEAAGFYASSFVLESAALLVGLSLAVGLVRSVWRWVRGSIFGGR